MKHKKLISALGVLMADAAVLYQKLRNFHWTVRGRHFFVLHAKFEELYGRWAEFGDSLAERILVLGGRPLGTLGQILSEATLSEEKEAVPRAQDMIKMLISDIESIRQAMGKAIELAEQEGDRGTINLLDSIRDEQEKTLWMLRTWLDPQEEGRAGEAS